MPGFKTFVAGATLPASEVNGYLMQQAVIVATSATRPASPHEGMFIYEADTNVYKRYDGAAWVSPWPLGEVSGVTLGSDSSATSSTTELVVATGSTTYDFDTDRTYKITASGKLFGTVAADRFLVRVRDTNTGGTERVAGSYVVAAVGSAGLTTFTMIGRVEGGWTGSVAPVVTLQRTSGTGTLNAQAGFALTVEDIGPA